VEGGRPKWSEKLFFSVCGLRCLSKFDICIFLFASICLKCGGVSIGMEREIGRVWVFHVCVLHMCWVPLCVCVVSV